MSLLAACRRTFFAVATVLLVSGCTNLPFYWQAARGQLDLLSRRVPVEEALADESLDEAVRGALQTAWEARRFAAGDLGLPDNKSYTTYADLERPYVVWNVFAAPEFSVYPKTWCFPFAGCVGYRGYFAEDNARREMEKLRDAGYDTYYGGVAAYSTLGRFADPIMNTMLQRNPTRTAALIFHELAHQKLYRPSDSTFSESFASFVEREGVRRWLDAREGGEDYAAYLDSLRYQREFSELVVAARARLAELYALDLEAADMRERKALEIERLRTDYASLKASWDGYEGYDGWFRRDLNNAHLATVSTYHRWVPAFRQLLHETDGDLDVFYARAQALADLDDASLEAAMSDLLAADEAGPGRR